MRCRQPLLVDGIGSLGVPRLLQLPGPGLVEHGQLGAKPIGLHELEDLQTLTVILGLQTVKSNRNLLMEPTSVLYNYCLT